MSKTRAALLAALNYYRCFSCSRGMFTTMNQLVLGESKRLENATHALGAGVARKGWGCGIISGLIISLGVIEASKDQVAEDFNSNILSQAGTIVDDFDKAYGKIDCSEITHVDFRGRYGFWRYIPSLTWFKCMLMSARFASRYASLSSKHDDVERELDLASLSQLNCVAAFIQSLDINQKDKVRLAFYLSGFAGGMGLRGSSCGLLFAGIVALGYARQPPNELIRRRRFFSSVKDELFNPDNIYHDAEIFVDSFIKSQGSRLCSELIAPGMIKSSAHLADVFNRRCGERIEHSRQLVNQIINKTG